MIASDHVEVIWELQLVGHQQGHDLQAVRSPGPSQAMLSSIMPMETPVQVCGSSCISAVLPMSKCWIADLEDYRTVCSKDHVLIIRVIAACLACEHASQKHRVVTVCVFTGDFPPLRQTANGLLLPALPLISAEFASHTLTSRSSL